MAQHSHPEQAAGAISVAGPCRPIVVAGAGPLLSDLTALMPGWPIEPAATTAPPDLTLQRTDEGFQLDGEGLPDGPATAGDPALAAQLVMIALTVCYMRQLPELIQVHGAGVKLGTGVVALLGDTQAGKTSVALHLTQLGCRLYGDDRLLLRPSGQDASVEAVSLSLAPRVRLPLPADVSEDFTRLIAVRSVLKLKDRAVLCLRDGEVAARGEAAPLVALVRLHRRDATAATNLQAAATAETLRALLSNCLAPGFEPQELVARAAALVSATPCFTIEFASSRDAAGVLARHFGAP